MTLIQAVFMFLLPLAAGVGLGFFYYGGLWLILRRLPQYGNPGAWVGLSLIVRTLVVVLALYLLFGDSWQKLLVAVAGMLIARTLLVQRVRPGADNTDKAAGQHNDL